MHARWRNRMCILNQNLRRGIWSWEVFWLRRGLRSNVRKSSSPSPSRQSSDWSWYHDENRSSAENSYTWWLDFYLGVVKGHWKNSLKIGHVTNTYIGGMYSFTMNSHDPKGLMRLWIDDCDRNIALSYPCRLRFLTHMHPVLPSRLARLRGTFLECVRTRGQWRGGMWT